MGQFKDEEMAKDQGWENVARSTGVGKCRVCETINPDRGQPWLDDGMCPSCATMFSANSND